MVVNEGVSRRILLYGSVAALAAGRAGVSSASNLAGGSWTDFLATFRPEAFRLLREMELDPASYVRRLSSEILTVSAIPSAERRPIPWMEPGMHFGMLAAGSPFVAIEWSMEPGAQQPCHNHPNGSVCTLLLEGELLMENFETSVAPENLAAERSFPVKRMRREVLMPGRTSVLTASENNLHRLTAGPQGARGIDLNTRHGADVRFSYIRLEPGLTEDEFVGDWYDPTAEIS